MLADHLNGFTEMYGNEILKYLEAIHFSKPIQTEYVFDDILSEKYNLLDISFSPTLKDRIVLCHYHDYTMHPMLNFKNFVCSFNGSNHVGRQLLVSILYKFGIFNEGYCSKNFRNLSTHMDGHFLNFGLLKNEKLLYQTFFTTDNNFLDNIYSFGHVQFDHANNIYNLETKITESFVHIVSETMSTSYYPFVTEKFLYSIVTRGLFVANAQPNWHSHVEKYYGFKKYDKIFDYSFDSIQNPIERIIKMMEMVLKFSKLSIHDWDDLYLMEQDTIEYNYDHYFSKRYMAHLKKYEN